MRLRLPTFRVRVLLAVVALSALATEFGIRFLLPTVRVPFASRPILRAELLGPGNVVVRLYPRIRVPAGAMTVREEWELYSRTVFKPFAKGEPITENRLAPRSTRRRDIVPSGYRAFTAANPEIVTEGPGPLLPGDKVGVPIPADAPPAPDQTEAPSADPTPQRILVAEVLAIETELEGGWQARSVTLLVSPYQAEQLQAAERKGRLRMTRIEPVER
jgi:Flp pilus assembly protein CpaB